MNDRRPPLAEDERLDLQAPDRYPPGTVERHLARYHWAAAKLREKNVRGRVLDAACGTGYGAPILKPGVAEVIGLDKSPEAVKTAHARYAKGDGRVTFFACDLDARLPYMKGYFGAVVSIETLEHLAQPGTFLREARRVLAPGGKLLVSTPETRYDEKTKKPLAPTNPYHLHEYAPDELKRLVEDSGFARVALEPVAAVPGFLFLVAEAA